MHRPTLITPPDVLPVSLAEAKLHLRVDHDDDDTLIEGLIRAATDHLDGWTGILGRCLVEQEWRQDFDTFEPSLPLALGPATSIVKVEAGGQAVDQAIYTLQTDAAGMSRVTFTEQLQGPVSVTYKAGYPVEDGKAQIPAALRVAILLLVGHWYQTREAATAKSVAELPYAVSALIEPYRRTGV